MTKPTNNVVEELLLDPKEALAPGEVVIGLLDSISASGEPLVDFSQNTASHPIPAISTLPVNAGHCGRQLALLFTEGNLNNPLIIGFIHSPLQEMIDGFELSAIQNDTEIEADDKPRTEPSNKLPDAIVDGKKVVIDAQEEVVLKCGDASITLTKSGKIMIRGKYILNRSTGVNRILGGSVQVN